MDNRVTVTSSREALITECQRVRRDTETLCSPLAVDDYQIQSIVQASPPKWHLAHVSWFVDAFVLPRFNPGYKAFNAQFD